LHGLPGGETRGGGDSRGRGGASLSTEPSYPTCVLVGPMDGPGPVSAGHFRVPKWVAAVSIAGMVLLSAGAAFGSLVILLLGLLVFCGGFAFVLRLPEPERISPTVVPVTSRVRPQPGPDTSPRPSGTAAAPLEVLRESGP
jgi:hypothetical protein